MVVRYSSLPCMGRPLRQWLRLKSPSYLVFVVVVRSHDVFGVAEVSVGAMIVNVDVSSP